MSATETPFISYAQNQEDVLLWRVFKDQPVGFYVDVGAAHPEWESVTKAFYDRGWRGINFEPNPHFFSMLEKERPRDINICALVGSEASEMELNIVGNTGLSTASSEGLKNLRMRNHDITSKITCKVVRLDDVLHEQRANEIQFLKIDAEGMEKEVLKGCSFVEFRPKILVIEVTIPETNILRNSGIREHLDSLGYRFVFFDGLNDYYVANECEKLASEFNRPVNILDNYQPAREIYFKQRNYSPKQQKTLARKMFLATKSTIIDRLVASGRDVFNKIRIGSNLRFNSKPRQKDVEWAYQFFLKRQPENHKILEYHLKKSANIKELVENITLSSEYSSKKVKLTADDIIWAYQHFLGRNPEDMVIVQQWLENTKCLRELIIQITSSREYRYKKNTNITSSPEEVFYFFHIQKTGGMSVHEYLSDSVSSEELLPGFLIEDFINSNVKSFRYFSGHYRNLPLKITSREINLATVLRNPVERTISHYQHAKRQADVPYHIDLKEITLNEFLISPLAPKFFGNYQARLLAEISPLSKKIIDNVNFSKIEDNQLFDLAMDGLSQINVVGVTERLDVFINALSKAWNLPSPTKNYFINSAPHKFNEELSDKATDKINMICAVDNMIYNEVLKNNAIL